MIISKSEWVWLLSGPECQGWVGWTLVGAGHQKGTVMKLKKLLCGAAIAASMLGGSVARAASIHVNLDSTTPSGLNTVYTYSLSIDALNQVQSGDGSVIFDFDGFQTGSFSVVSSNISGATWTFTYDGRLITPDTGSLAVANSVVSGLGDNASIGNLNIQYTGSAAAGWLTSNPNSFTGNIIDTTLSNGFLKLLTFSVTSSLNTVRTDSYYSQDHNVATSGVDQNQGQVGVAGLPGGLESPLPASVLGGLGLLSLLAGKKAVKGRL